MKCFGVFVILLVATGAHRTSAQEDYYEGNSWAYNEAEEYEYDEYNNNNGDEAINNSAAAGNLPADSDAVDPPEFNVSPQTFTPIEGTSVSIPCTLTERTGHVLLIYRIPKSGQEALLLVNDRFFNSDNRFSISNSVLTIQDVKRTDSDRYNCVYQYEQIKRVNVTHTLDVYYAPSVRRKQRTIKANAGESAEIACVTSGHPTPKITWSKQDGSMPSGAGEEVGTSITFEDVDRRIAGSYVCIADNGVGEPAKGIRYIEVSYPPEIHTEKEIIHTGDGGRVELVCVVHSFPAATVEWFHEGTPVDSDSRAEVLHGGHRHLLNIDHVTDADFGTYVCKAQNSLGSSEKAIEITDAPSAPSITSDRYSAEEDSYTVAWTTNSYYPIATYVLKYRKTKVNDSINEPGEWMEITENPEDSQPDIQRTFQHTLTDLDRATDYEGELSVVNTHKPGAPARFTFSTRKETEEHLTSGAQTLPVSSLITASIILCVRFLQ